MKVVFLFMSKGCAQPGSIKTNEWLFQDCGPQYQATFGDECYFKMLETLVENKTITDLKVFYESNVNPGRANFVKGADCYVIPEIRLVEDFIDDDTIIFARGGFKHWHDWLLKYKNKNWLMIYAANTGREKWKWWDINFNDCGMDNILDVHGRYQFPFVKPTNEDVFYCDFSVSEPKYDICIGASHIHDKKGQYHGVKLMKVFCELFGYYPSAVMPGGIRRSTYTTEMVNDPVFINEVHCPGMLSKPDLKKLYDETKFFIHLGTVGQNDRSIIEAYACGVPVGIRNLKAHTPLLSPNEDTIVHFDLDDDPDYVKSANKLKLILDNWSLDIKHQAYADYKMKMGYFDVAIPALTRLFEILEFEGGPSIQAKEHLVYAFEYLKGGICQTN